MFAIRKPVPAGVAVENDYNLLVFNLGQVVELVFKLQDEVEKRLVKEKAGALDPNATQWVGSSPSG